MKIIFLGTPEFAEIVLEKLLKSNHQVLAVVCQADKPNARGNKIEFCRAKVCALKHYIKLFQFEKITPDAVTEMKNLNPDILVTAAYGKLLRQDVLDLAPYGVINVHGSLLPKYRGASPIQTAILNGEKETGITIMKTFIGMDDGDIIMQKKLKIEDEDNYGTLSKKLANEGGDMLITALDNIEEGKAKFTPQNHDEATFTKMLKKESCFLNFYEDAFACVNKIRAYNPNPIIKLSINGKDYKIFSAHAEKDETKAQNGEVLEASAKKGLVIKCANNTALFIDEMQAENGKKMNSKSYLNGNKIEKGIIL